MHGPLKSKSGSKTADAITEIIRKNGRHPKNLQTDMGKEFYNADVQQVVNKQGINHYPTYSVMKASVVERFNRTLKNDMWKMFTLNGNCKWIDLLPRLVSNYKLESIERSVRVSKYKTIFKKGYTPNWTTDV